MVVIGGDVIGKWLGDVDCCWRSGGSVELIQLEGFASSLELGQ
jgi:hypothetical protein